MADIYCNVDTGNDTTGDGSSGTPYAQIEKCIDVATTNDVIIAAPSSTSYNWTNPKTLPAGLTIRSSSTAPPDAKGVTNSVVLDAGGGKPQWTLSGDVTIERIWFKNWSDSLANASGIYPNHIASINQVIQFTNCIFEDIVAFNSTNGRGGFIGNGGSVSGYTQTTIQVNIDNSLFWNIKGTAAGANCCFLYLWTSYYLAPNIRNCTWYNDATGDQPMGLISAYSSGATGPVFKNFIAHTDHATTAYPYRRYGGFTTDTYSAENCCWGTNITNGSGITETACITADPLMLDVANGDFRLKATSPCIDAGQII